MDETAELTDIPLELLCYESKLKELSNETTLVIK